MYIGKTKDDLSPVTAILTYLKMRGKNPGPLLQWSTGVPLTRGRFVEEVKSALVLVGVDTSKYSGQSFRIGAATTAAAAGLEDSLI